ncbi:hypothetical protein [Oceanobacillus manasiensis]|uniref:hypothetical protein n=1 Tax=Oceanobacillus manasiensis TaxID=586413 RepID=UPI0005AB7A78|nr:hypothetical protein [Oceanobacillus manasiensis]
MSVRVEEFLVEEVKDIPEWIRKEDEGKELLNIVVTSSYQHAFTAWENNALVGILVSWYNQFHPHCTYIKIMSNSKTDDELVVGALMNRLKQKEVKYPLQTSLWESSIEHRNTLKAYGFMEIRRTYLPCLNSEQIIGKPVLNLENAYLLSLTEVKENITLRDELINLVKSNYERSHMVNPVATLNISDWEELIFAEDLIERGSYLAIEKGSQKLLAYSFLHHSTEQDRVELGWCGTNDNKDINLLQNLVSCQLYYIKSEGFQKVEGEFDTTDPFAMEILKSFPFKQTEAWITYQLEKAPAT